MNSAMWLGLPARHIRMEIRWPLMFHGGHRSRRTSHHRHQLLSVLEGEQAAVLIRDIGRRQPGFSYMEARPLPLLLPHVFTTPYTNHHTLSPQLFGVFYHLSFYVVSPWVDYTGGGVRVGSTWFRFWCLRPIIARVVITDTRARLVIIPLLRDKHRQ